MTQTTSDKNILNGLDVMSEIVKNIVPSNKESVLVKITLNKDAMDYIDTMTDTQKEKYTHLFAIISDEQKKILEKEKLNKFTSDPKKACLGDFILAQVN